MCMLGDLLPEKFGRMEAKLYSFTFREKRRRERQKDAAMRAAEGLLACSQKAVLF